MRWLAVAALVAVLWPAHLPAQSPGPVVVPTRDVDIHYRIAEGRAERLRWQVSAHRLRVDPPLEAAYIILDLATHRLSFVRPALRAVTDTVSGPPVPAAGAGGFTRGGQDAVAGLRCTEWSTAAGNGTQTESCLTDDGVLLRARVRPAPAAPGGLLLEATSVVYGPMDDAAFLIPADFTHTAQEPAAP